MRCTLGYVRSFSSKKHRFGTKKCVCAAAHSRLRPADGLVRRSLLRQTSVFAGGEIGNVLDGFEWAFPNRANEKTCTVPPLFRAQALCLPFCVSHDFAPAHAKGPPVSERTAPGLVLAQRTRRCGFARHRTRRSCFAHGFGSGSSCGSRLLVYRKGSTRPSGRLQRGPSPSRSPWCRRRSRWCRDCA